MRVSQMQIDLLHRGDFSLVLMKDDAMTTFTQRGVADLYELLTTNREMLEGALAADKVVGKGAAALLILGGVSDVYADVISESALQLFHAEGVPVSYKQLVPHIMNRAKTGYCPVEQLCLNARTAEEAFPLIEKFIKDQKHT